MLPDEYWMSDSLRSQIFDEYLLRHVLIDEATHLGLTITNTKVKKIAQDIPQMRSTVSRADG